MSFIQTLTTYFDLQSDKRIVNKREHLRSVTERAPSTNARATFTLGRMHDFESARSASQPAPVLPQYLALVLGVVVQPYLQYYVQHGGWSLTFTDIIGRVAFGLIIGGLAFPAVYKNAFDLDKPLLVQLCAIFSAGIGWQSVIQGGAKAALGV